ncbi:MAG: helix-turn-helix transcriptional regulator [Ktedonobacteraceae bacterium]|nr:helix-turn-helix transcriptional regulator [Ktedonobacteraceae bacterium]
MKADHFSQNDSLAFSFSFREEVAGPEVEGPSRFARALKRARFARSWTQAKLAKQLAISKRSIVSWETGERIPSVGMVILLLDALFSDEELSLHRELVTAYIVDDLERQEQRRDPQRDPDDPLLLRVQRVMAQVLQLSLRATQARPVMGNQVAEKQADDQLGEHEPLRPQGKADNQQVLEPLFALMTQLGQHPELIPVARDFIRELAPGG